MDQQQQISPQPETLTIPLGDVELIGDLTALPGMAGLVLFAHGSGSGRLSPRNRYVAASLHQAQLGTLLVDLLTTEEQLMDEESGELRFDIPLLSDRLAGLVEWTRRWEWPIGLYGASTGAAAALNAAAAHPQLVGAVVSRGGRPDLAMEQLPRVRAPTLLVVGGNDPIVIDLNERAFDLLQCEKRLEIVPGASHLFEEPGALEQVAMLARSWFAHHLA